MLVHFLFMIYILLFYQTVRASLEETGVGKAIISEIDEGELTRKSRMKFVRIVAAHIIRYSGDR